MTRKKIRSVPSKKPIAKPLPGGGGTDAAGSAGTGTEEIIGYLEAILNLQCETQDDMAELEKKLEQLRPKAQEAFARVSGIQAEVEDLSSCIGRLLRQDRTQPPPAPEKKHPLRSIGVAAILAPLIWNGIAGGVIVMQKLTGPLSVSTAVVMTAVISAAWGLLLICVEPPLDRLLQELRESRRACETEEDRELEEYLNGIGKDKDYGTADSY